MEDQKLDKLERMKALLNEETPTQEELAEIFSALLKAFKESVSSMEERVANGERGLLQKQQELMRQGEEAMAKWQALTTSLEVQEQQKGEEIAKLEGLLNRLENLKPEDLVLEVASLTETRLKPLIPKMEEIKRAINSNVKEREGVTKSVIEKLGNEIKKIRKELVTRTSGLASRRVFQPHRDDLSAFCNGTDKTFYLSRSPLKDGTVMVYGTDFPVILRPTIDFTIADKTLTLTSAVPAPSLGATLITTYYA